MVFEITLYRRHAVCTKFFPGMMDMQKISRILSSLIIIILINRVGILVPLTFLGAYLGHQKKAIENPCEVNKVPRPIPRQVLCVMLNQFVLN